MASHLKAAWRLLRAIVHAVGGWFTIVFVFPRLERAQRNARVQSWSLEMLRVMGVELRIEGTPPASGPMLLAANHISWLDILVMHAAKHCRFVAKSDIKHWPLIGPLATGGGTLYIERESRRDAMRVVHRMAESLQAGEIVGVFPEGTTSDGTQVLPFHANLLQAAIAADAPVQPMAIVYLDRGGAPSLAPRYDGDVSLFDSVWSTLATEVVAVVRFGEPERAEGRDRRSWAHALRERVIALRGD